MSFWYLLVLCPALTLGIVLKPYNKTALEIYNDVDLDGDGSVNLSDVDQYFLLIDRDHSGEASKQEFELFIADHYPDFKGYEDIMYTYFDRSADGRLTKLDLEEMFEQSDTNRDHIITEVEHVDMAQRLMVTQMAAICQWTEEKRGNGVSSLVYRRAL